MDFSQWYLGRIPSLCGGFNGSSYAYRTQRQRYLSTRLCISRKESVMTSFSSIGNYYDYVQSVLRDMKNSPPLEVGMHVAVYSWSYDHTFWGYGIIQCVEWNEFYYQHISEVLMNNGDVIDGLLVMQIERVVSPTKLRSV